MALCESGTTQLHIREVLNPSLLESHFQRRCKPTILTSGAIVCLHTPHAVRAMNQYENTLFACASNITLPNLRLPYLGHGNKSFKDFLNGQFVLPANKRSTEKPGTFVCNFIMAPRAGQRTDRQPRCILRINERALGSSPVELLSLSFWGILM